MINAEQAREMVQKYVEDCVNFHLTKIEALITKTAEVGKYYAYYKPENFLDSRICNLVMTQISSAGFQVSWDGSKTEMVVNWYKR